MRDVLDWLLPEATAQEAARVRRLITALRLLRDDARATAARAEGQDERVAALELRRLEQRRRQRTFEGLLHAGLSARLPRDSFLDLGPAPMPYEECLRAALDDPGARAWLPRPGEEPRAGLERLLRAGAESPLSRAALELWRARRAHVLEGPAQAEVRWAEALRRARRDGTALGWQAVYLAGRVAARLDRFDPRGAWALFAGHEVLASLEPGLCRLFAWSALACGRATAARELAAAAGEPAGRPGPVLEMERALGCAADVEEASAIPERGPPREASRRELGAVVLATFLLRGETRVACELDTAPAVREAVARRLRERAAAWREPGQPEFDLVRGARVVRRDRPASEEQVRGTLRERLGESACPGVLAGRGSCALALAPILDAQGLVRGWLHVESEHHLLPSRARLLALAQARGRALAPREPAAVRASSPPVSHRRLEDDDPRVAFLERVTRAAWPGDGRRRAYLVQSRAAGLSVLAERGAALADWLAGASRAPAVRQALGSGLAASFADPGAGLHVRARSGCVVPLALPGAGPAQVAVVVESTRSGDLAPSADALEALRRSWLPGWRAAAFRAWHRDRHDDDLAWEPTRRFPRAVEGLALGAARVRTPLLVVGPPGSGRRVLTRFVHFLGSNGETPWVEGPRAPRAEGLRVLELARLDLEAQEGLADELGDAPGRTVLLAEEAPQALAARGRLARALWNRLDPVGLEVPRLADRRDEIPDLARELARRRARREGLEPVRFSDHALAHLWRQDWDGQVPELEAVVGRLVRCRPGAEISGTDVRSAAQALHLAWRARLPSLRPRPLDLSLALACTRHANGSNNHARAARYLGWDPDTLQRRCQK